MSAPSTTRACAAASVQLSEPAAAGYCHCAFWQRRTGTAASALARTDGRTFRLLQGEDLVKACRHGDGGFEKCFAASAARTCSAATRTTRPR